jgi:nitroreductase
MDTVTAIHTRRSIRDYEKRAVEREIITDLLWDAAQAPTTPVSGPFLFHVIEGVARIADLGERAKQYAREHRPDAGGHLWADRPDFKVFLDAPVAIVISGHAGGAASY